MHLILKLPFISIPLSPPLPASPELAGQEGKVGVKAVRQDQRAHLSPNSPEPTQVRHTLEEGVKLGVGAGRRTSESKVGYWLGHILEERVSQSCLC